MVEIHLKLGFDAITEIIAGNAVSADVDQEDLRIVLMASDRAVQQFEQEAQKAMLHFLQTPAIRQ